MINRNKKIGKVLTAFIQKQISPLLSSQTDKSNSTCSLSFKQTAADLLQWSWETDTQDERRGERRDSGGGEEKEERKSHVEVTASPETGNEEVSRFQLYSTSVAPPRLLTHYFQPAEERCHKKRERVGRTRESDEDDSEPGEMRHSFWDDKVVLKAKEVESHHMRY